MDGERASVPCLVTRDTNHAPGGSSGAADRGPAALLQALTPPAVGTPRRDYRPYVTAEAGRMSCEDLRSLCAFFRCDVTRVVTRIMDYQYERARALAILEPNVARAGKGA